MKNNDCEQCKKNPITKFKKVETICVVCKKEVKKILDLHHTNAHICSFECERDYWLDILI